MAILVDQGYRILVTAGLLRTVADHPEVPDLVAELAHTLRSRLTSILFLAETLYDATPREEHATRRQLGLLYASALGATVFTSNLMELIRGGQDLVGQEPEPLSIPALLRRIRDAEPGARIGVLRATSPASLPARSFTADANGPSTLLGTGPSTTLGTTLSSSKGRALDR